MGRSSLHRPGGQGVDKRTATSGDLLDVHLEAGTEGVRLHVQERLIVRSLADDRDDHARAAVLDRDAAVAVVADGERASHVLSSFCRRAASPLNGLAPTALSIPRPATGRDGPWRCAR